MTSNIIRTLVDLDDSAPHTLSSNRLTATAPLPGQSPFPAALLDALAGYNYLVNEIGYSPSNTILVGDSVGENLALVLTRYLSSGTTRTSYIALPLSRPNDYTRLAGVFHFLQHCGLPRIPRHRTRFVFQNCAPGTF